MNEHNGSVPTCSDNDPDSRHFCMDGYGRINWDPADANPNLRPDPTDYYCDPHYDADDYARDRVDFAALINYMDRGADGKPKKGNFIAMYSIFFRHSAGGPINENILGVKFMRYIADAGDNGIIDNHLQKWYRDTRDAGGGDGKDSWRKPPMGLNEGVGTAPEMKLVQLPPPGAGSTAFTFGTSPKPQPAGGTQPVPPSYNGTNTTFGSAPEDECATYDFRETGAAPGSSAYETLVQTDCGQYFFANNAAKVNKAFIEIAGRLFTRLSR